MRVLPPPRIADPMRFQLFVLSCLSAALCACGSGRTYQEFVEPAPDLSSVDSAPGKNAPQHPDQYLTVGLPALDKLPQPVLRVPSVTGPGYIPLSLSERLAAHDVSGTNGELILPLTAGGLSWALYGVGGFDGSARPTSLKLQHAASDQEVYLAFGDFVNQRWALSGPYGPFAAPGELEVEVPYGPEHISPSSFTSPPGVGAKDGRFFFALMLQDNGSGNELRFTDLELGSHGGSLGPRPGREVFTQLADLGFLTVWEPSPDSGAPDFAGYLVERAPLFIGSFSSVTPEPLPDPYYIDPGTSILEPYRYRVRAVDTAGNSSPWFSVFDSSGAILLGSPAVALLDMPRGPLFGAQDVHFDLSRSFAANSGNVITEYEVEVSGPVSYTGTEPQTTLRLQPGCYVVTGKIRIDAFSTVRTQKQLVIYPTWEPVSSLIAAAPTHGFIPRLTKARAFRHPANDQPYVCGFDNTLPAFTVWRGRPGNLDFIGSVPVYGTPAGTCEPVFSGGAAWISFETSEGSSILRIDPDGLEQSAFPLPIGDSPRMIEGPGGNLRMIVETEGGGMSNLILLSLGGPFGFMPMAVGLDSIIGFDAGYNQASGLYDVLYYTATGVSYLAYDEVSNSVLHGPASVLPGSITGLDLEYDPLAGRSVAQVLTAGEMRYLEWADDGMITANQHMEPAISFPDFDLLLHDGQKYSAFASDAGQARLYRQEGSNWVVLNIFDYSSDSAYQLCLIPPAAPGGALLVLDQLGPGDANAIELSRLDAADVETHVASLLSQDASGYCIQAVEGLGGINLVWADLLGGVLQHASSDTGGDSWILQPSPSGFPPLSSPRHALGAVRHFGVSPPPDTPYLTYFNGAAYNLYAWDGLSWNFAGGKAGAGNSQPYLNVFPEGNLVMMGYSEDSTQSYRIIGNIDDGFMTTDLDLPDMRIPRAGVINNADLPGDLYEHNLILGESAGFRGLDLHHPGPDQLEYIREVSSSGGELDPSALLTSPYVSGSTLASSAFMQANGRPALAFWGACDRFYNAVRLSYVSPQADGDPLFALEDIPLEIDNGNIDPRRTVSAAVANGGTALGLLCSLDGKLQRLEWSNFGAWEELALPPGLDNMASAEVLVDSAGRWHIFYRDVATGDVMARRTQD